MILSWTFHCYLQWFALLAMYSSSCIAMLQWFMLLHDVHVVVHDMYVRTLYVVMALCFVLHGHGHLRVVQYVNDNSRETPFHKACMQVITYSTSLLSLLPQPLYIECDPNHFTTSLNP